MRYLLIPAILFIFSTGCGKDDDPPGPTKTDHITSSAWKYESGGVDQDRNGTIDFTFAATGVLEPCVLDNTGTFLANNTGTTDEGLTKCSPTIPQTSIFNWSFTNNETMINISGSGLLGIGGQFKIITLTPSVFSFSKDTLVTIPPFPTTTVSLIVNLKH